ncbi:MAG: hypothetical protein ACI32C_04835 [Candidatus Enteromonas sp.]
MVGKEKITLSTLSSTFFNQPAASSSKASVALKGFSCLASWASSADKLRTAQIRG